MKRKQRTHYSLLVASILLAGIANAAAQSDAELPGNSYASIARLPDWSGIWEVTFGRGGVNTAPALTLDYIARQKAYHDAQASGAIQDTPAANCVPPGLPSIMGQPYPMEFLVTPGKITIVLEAYTQVRQIFTDGRPHPEDPDPTFNGHSIGRWDGDTLVVDTVGFVTDTPLSDYSAQHSDQMRVVERMRLVEPDTLEIETTVTDPLALTAPWTSVRRYGRHRDWTLAEYICQQNNRNFTDETGKAGINLKHAED